MTIVGFDTFGQNNTLSLKAETKVFNAAATKPYIGSWDGTEVTYDSTESYDLSSIGNFWTVTSSKRADYSKMKPYTYGSRTWYLWITPAASARVYSWTGHTGYEIAIWMAPSSLHGKPDIVIPYHQNVTLSNVPYQAMVDAIYAGNVVDSSIPYTPPAQVNCGSQGWRGHFTTDSYGNCECSSDSNEISGGTKVTTITGAEASIPQGETWCVKDDVSCTSQQIKYLDELSYSMKCEDRTGCTDSGNKNYDSNAVIHYGSMCHTNCKWGYKKSHLGIGDGSCSKLLESWVSSKNDRDRYSRVVLVKSGWVGKYYVARQENIHDVANPTGNTSGKENFNDEASARAHYNTLTGTLTVDVEGCTDPTASNYNPDANKNNDSCTYDVSGCMDSAANNYDSTATTDDGSCTYTTSPIVGCTDSTAINYNPSANEDDGSCTYSIAKDKSIPIWAIPAGIVGALAMIIMISKK